MSCRFEIIKDTTRQEFADPNLEFKKEVLNGLSRNRKSLPSRFFYDASGSDLFDQITHHPDYYLTNCEIEILNRYRPVISEYLNDAPFNLIELGPGDGSKPQILVESFLGNGLDFTYMPIDISEEYLKSIAANFEKLYPDLDMTAINSDFFEGLRWLTVDSGKRNVLLFFGASIGNFTPQEARDFLRYANGLLNPGDYILIGFDLLKDINKLLRAYNDSAGITSRFNLNLLHRMNTELGANFNISNFQHYETYNVYAETMESYIVSMANQSVEIRDLGMLIHFDELEPIHVEYSQKYRLWQIESMARATGFELVQHFHDSQHYFVDTLWRKPVMPVLM